MATLLLSIHAFAQSKPNALASASDENVLPEAIDVTVLPLGELMIVEQLNIPSCQLSSIVRMEI